MQALILAAGKGTRLRPYTNVLHPILLNTMAQKKVSCLLLERRQVYVLQCAQFLRRAHFCQETGFRRALFGRKYGL